MRMIQWFGAAGVIAMTVVAVGCDESQAETPVSAEEIAAKAKGAFAKDGEVPACCALPEKAEIAKPQATATAAPVTETKEAIVEGPRASAWQVPADRPAFDLDYTLTDQDGKAVKLADLRGKPIAMTFFFTRCPLPTMCPLIVTTMARLQMQLDQAGLGKDVHLLLVSYDPTHDTPEAMKKYGEDRGLVFTNAAMLRPTPEDLRGLIHEFNIGVKYYTDGSIGHFIELLVLDRDGRFVRDYTGGIWDNAKVADDLARLVAEPASDR